MKTIRVGVIGVGRMGERHCRVYSNLRHAQLVGVCDASLTLGQRVAQQYEVPFYANVDDLLKYVDAVTIATPTPHHFDLTMKCIERGIHVMVEKPFTETVEQAEQLAQAAEASRLVVQVGHIERFNSTYIELKNVMGGMNVLALNWRRLSPYAGSNTDVDVILDLMIHDLDLALDLMGRDPDAVTASGLTAYSGVVDHVVAQLHYTGGPLVTLTTSRATEQKVRMIELTAMEAFVEGDLLNKSIAVHRRTIGEYLPHNKYRQESLLERLQVPMTEPLVLEQQAFIESIREGKPSQVPARQGLRVLQLAETVRQTCQQNMLVMGQVRARQRGTKPLG